MKPNTVTNVSAGTTSQPHAGKASSGSKASLPIGSAGPIQSCNGISGRSGAQEIQENMGSGSNEQDRNDMSETKTELSKVKAYCARCTAPTAPMMAVLMRCGLCAVVNGQLPPTKFKQARMPEGQ